LIKVKDFKCALWSEKYIISYYVGKGTAVFLDA